MMTAPAHPPLPADLDWPRFDALQEDTEAWRPVIEALAARHSPLPVRATSAGTVLVGLIGEALVLKLYPPFLRDHFAFEAGALPRLHGRLSLPTPELLHQGEYQGWPYLLMSQLPGDRLDARWPGLDEPARLRVLHTIGRVAAEVHALPVGTQAALAPDWTRFLAGQRAGCRRRQERVGLPAHLLVQLESFVEGPLPEGPPVILTGEYTPMNLLYADQSLSAMFDFGDGLVGPATYDWLGPLCFLAAGHRERVDAFLTGYGAPLDRAWRLPALRLLLLHRYSHPPAQIACPGWQDEPNFESVAARIWP